VHPDGAFATILNAQGAVLLSHRRDLDLWNPPGGGIEPGESPWAAVVRETYEETGLHVAVASLASVTWKTRYDCVVFQFHCRVTGGALRLTDEADEHRYFSTSELPANLSRSFERRLLLWSGDRTQTHLLSDDGPSTRERLEAAEPTGFT
jgi:8-oxo-dGTP diphosphatase